MDKRVEKGARLAKWSLRLTILALAAAAIGLTLARYDVIGKLAGFSALLGGGLIALLALLLGIASLFVARRTAGHPRQKLGASMLVSLLYVGFLASRPLVAGDAPAIHDLTTDLANPPPFQTLALRADNLTGVGSLEKWRQIHASAYRDLQPIMIAKPVPLVTAEVVRLAEQAGWKIASSDSARGHVEATASTSYIRFNDDVVFRITPAGDGKTSRIDMRSVSRVGVGDLGVNAKRIRAFLASLASSPALAADR